jgi:hypothetical protein
MGMLAAVALDSATASTEPEQRTFGETDYGGELWIRVKSNEKARTNPVLDRAWGPGVRA